MMNIQIGQTSWKVVVVDGMEDFGQTDYFHAILRLREDQTQDQMKDSLWHEIIHAACFAYGVPIGSLEQEESIIKTLAPVLLDILCRNPELISVLVGDLDINDR